MVDLFHLYLFYFHAPSQDSCLRWLTVKAVHYQYKNNIPLKQDKYWVLDVSKATRSLRLVGNLPLAALTPPATWWATEGKTKGLPLKHYHVGVMLEHSPQILWIYHRIWDEYFSIASNALMSLKEIFRGNTVEHNSLHLFMEIGEGGTPSLFGGENCASQDMDVAWTEGIKVHY